MTERDSHKEEPKGPHRREPPFKQAAPPALNLPKSGGSLRGLGEKFQAGSATGTGSMQVPLPLSPGRGGGEPKLSLSYDSGAPHGPFGIGWTVSVPSITRRTDKGIPRYADAEESDIFTFSGQEDLVPVLTAAGTSWTHVSTSDGAYRVDAYAPRVEGLFARVERRTHSVTGDTHWRAITPDNVTSVFGLSAAARIADPANPLHIFKWLLESTFDAYGHVTFYEYKAEDLTGVSVSDVSEATRFASMPANRYLKRVHYGNRVPLATRNPAYADIAGLTFLFEVVFDYGEHTTDLPAEISPWAIREDPFSNFRSGFEIRTYRLCQRVLMFHEIQEELLAPARLVRAVELGYEVHPTVSYLITVRQVGYAWDSNNLITTAYTPTLHLDYSKVGSLFTKVQFVDPDSLAQSPGEIDGHKYQFIDLDGEGIAGILTPAAHPAPALIYKRNMGDGAFAAGDLLALQPSLSAVAEDVQLLSLNADGRVDVARLSGPTPGYFERTRDFGWTSFQTFPSMPRIDFGARGVHFLDVDGDGLTDILVAEDDVFVWYPSLSRSGYGPAKRVTQAHDERRGAVVLTTDDFECIFLADMTGDGLSDLVRIRGNGDICYWPNLGYGRFGAKIVMRDAPVFAPPDLFDPRHVRLGDIDGTGVTDVVYLSGEGATVYFNEAGNGWAPGILIPLPRIDSTASIRIADLLGTGTSCLVWSSSEPTAAQASLRYVDLLNSIKPHLLTTVINGVGAQTSLEYVSSTQFYLEDRLAGHPWATRLPFPVQTVARITTIDEVTLTENVQRFRYAHGFYDGVEREFRGFARVDAWDADAMSSDHGAGPDPGQIAIANGQYDLPPIHTVTWYHTGAWNGERDDLRAALSAEFYAGDAQATPLLPNTVPPDLLPPALREAYRSLKGHKLRQEVYAEDGAASAGVPYTVSESRYEIREIQPIAGSRHGVYFPFERETRVYHYERNAADPRISQSLNLEIDALGHIVRDAHVAYARRVPAQPEQAQTIATCHKKIYAVPYIASYDYLHGFLTESVSYELALPANAVPLPLISVDTAMIGAAVLPFDGALAAGTMRVIEHVQHQYWSDDLSAPLPVGTVQSRPLIYDHFALALPGTELTSVFGASLAGADLLAAGYIAFGGDYWTHAGITAYSAPQFYQPTSFTDPFGNTASVVFDAFALFVIEEHTSQVAAFDNVTAATMDYRVLLPSMVTDPNGNRNAVAFDPLGMVVATAVMGTLGSGDGDTLSDPTTRIEYDLLAWEVATPGPVYFHTYVRQQHGASNPGWFETYSYFDGFGREALKKTQAEPDAKGNPQWSASNRTVYDNKNNPIKKYEPYFSPLPDFDTEASLTSKAFSEIRRYDPLSRVIRIDFSDGTFSSTEWDSWSEVRSDADDNVLLSAWYTDASSRPPSDPLNRAAALAAACANTPATYVLDPLGRTILSTADNGVSGQYATRTQLDVQGNELSITDPAGVVTLKQVFDAQGNILQHQSPDAGTARAINDGIGRPLKAWDPRGFIQAKQYDQLHRLIQVWVTPPGGASFLSELLVYGESLAAPNFRGRTYQHFDGAGVLTNALYDFENRITRSTRQLASSYTATPAWDALSGVVGAANVLPAAIAAHLLESDVFATATTFDAMSRIVNLTTPDATEVVPAYSTGSLLSAMTAYMQGGATATPIVTNVLYNAQRQRVAISYGTGINTQYTYDDRTHMVLRVLTTRSNDSAALQDLNYTYDPAHNIMQIADRAQQTVYFSGSVTTGTQLFQYDPIYRITQASGRELASQTGFAISTNGYPDPQFSSIPSRNDLQALLAYTENYTYDTVGNIQTTHHQVSGGGGWTRTQTYVAGSNKLDRVSMPGDPSGGPYSGIHTHDAAGNMLSMPHLASIVWDHDGRMQSADLLGGGMAYFTYDSTGQRVRKIIVRANQVLERVYIGNYERYRELNGTAPTGTPISLERDSVHIYDGHRRFAMADTKTIDTSVNNLVPTTQFRLQFGNHLGSACLETDLNANIISYEEYYPFGGSSYRAGDTNKRYRYSGKERDEETGLYYHGARYYAPWLARWTSPDPINLASGDNSYAYVSNNPVKYSDPTGLYDWPSWKTVAVVAAVVVVGTVVTIATAGAAAPLIGAAVAGAGLTGTAATVVTGVAVGAIAGAAGGVAGEVARTEVAEGRLPTKAELKKAAVSGAIGGAVSGGIGSAASAARTGVAATRAASVASTASRAARITRAVAGVAKAGATGAAASATAEAGSQLVLDGHIDAKKVGLAAYHGFVGGVAGHAASSLVGAGAGAIRRAVGPKVVPRATPAATPSPEPAATPANEPTPPAKPSDPEYVDLTDAKGRQHILEGEPNGGGGHGPGRGVPNKSEFPGTWSDERVLHEISDIATDPKQVWSPPDNRGYSTTTKTVDGIDVKVVVDTRNSRIVTGFPTNVPRNP